MTNNVLVPQCTKTGVLSDESKRYLDEDCERRARPGTECRRDCEDDDCCGETDCKDVNEISRSSDMNGFLTHVFELFIQCHPRGIIYVLVVHAEESSEEAERQLSCSVRFLGRLCENKHTKKIVTNVKAMIALPCLTLSSALFNAAFASMILACCCFSDNSP
mgnify:CR=1 FL=1